MNNNSNKTHGVILEAVALGALVILLVMPAIPAMLDNLLGIGG